jgi:hypothetical protein
MRAAGRRMRRVPPFVSMSSGRGSSRPHIEHGYTVEQDGRFVAPFR